MKRSLPDRIEDQTRRLWAKTEVVGDCWIWTGGIQKDGYPLASVLQLDGDYKSTLVRRWAWEDAYEEEIPAGAVVTVTCGQQLCVRPEHLRPVDNAANVTRIQRRRWSGRTHCPQGHELAAVGKTRKGACAECSRRATRNWQRRNNTPEYRARRAKQERERRARIKKETSETSQ